MPIHVYFTAALVLGLLLTFLYTVTTWCFDSFRRKKIDVLHVNITNIDCTRPPKKHSRTLTVTVYDLNTDSDEQSMEADFCAKLEPVCGKATIFLLKRNPRPLVLAMELNQTLTIPYDDIKHFLAKSHSFVLGLLVCLFTTISMTLLIDGDQPVSNLMHIAMHLSITGLMMILLWRCFVYVDVSTTLNHLQESVIQESRRCCGMVKAGDGYLGVGNKG